MAIQGMNKLFLISKESVQLQVSRDEVISELSCSEAEGSCGKFPRNCFRITVEVNTFTLRVTTLLLCVSQLNNKIKTTSASVCNIKMHRRNKRVNEE
jgi:hypothetical protein